MTIEGIDITPLLKARSKFNEFCQDLSTEKDKAAAIQAFEYTYELAWKTMKRLIAKRGTILGSPRPTFRQAKIEGLIQDPEEWFKFIDIRNITVHTYDEMAADKVIDSLEDFSKELDEFLKNIGAIK